MNDPVITTVSSHQAHAVSMANVFTQAALDAAAHGIAPTVIQVDTYQKYNLLTVGVHVSGEDVAAVDRLAEFYGIDAATEDYGLYMRAGNTVLAGDLVHVRIYCGRVL